MSRLCSCKVYAICLQHINNIKIPNILFKIFFLFCSLQKEIDEINYQLERMHKALKELENQHQKLLRTRTMLEHDLALKIDAMYIDKEKVCGLRRAYPVNALFRF